MSKIFLAWRQRSHCWWPVGQLIRESDGGYEFRYTKGALKAEREANFAPILSFPDFERTYRSEALFPMFSNRLLSENRPEYSGFMKALDLPVSDWSNPISVLGRSGGRRMTDTFEVFPLPERTPDGRYLVKFFIHGLEHRSEDVEAAINDLHPGDRLELEEENDNEADTKALRIVASLHGQRLGYVPRYLCGDIRAIECFNDGGISLEVAHINPTPTPKQFRILCQLDAPWANGFTAFADEEFTPIVKMTV